MKNKTVSVIIPVYNAGKYLGEALESILMQSVKPAEIIVVDDGSTDNSLEVAQQFGKKITILRHAVNKGCGAARNSGIKAAVGPYLAFLDADDLWVEGKLEKQMNFLQNNPDIDMVLGNVEQFISPELTAENQRRLKEELKKMPGYVTGTMLLRKQVFDQVGMFNEKLELGEFIDWFARAKDMGLKYFMFDEIMLKRRIHTTNMGITKKQHLNDYTAILRAALARKRNQKK